MRKSKKKSGKGRGRVSKKAERWVNSVRKNREDIIAIMAGLFVLLTAMINTKVSFELAVIFIAAFILYRISQMSR